ncbi:ead/Ea22-like family protein [Salmonella enterica subsp. enterica serovar Uganda]|nr:ead/Ea22-like family protein [Salmonella enterica subsp. enterica serovar Uganda]
MSDINKQALRLRKFAKKATQGEWCAYVDSGTGTYAIHTPDDESYVNIVNWPGFDCRENAKANAEFIAEFNPKVAQALLDELEAKDSTIATQQQEIRTLLNALEQATEKRNSDRPGQKRLIGWRASDYTDETSDPELAKNWAAAIGVLPIFEGDVNTKLSTAGIGKGE